MNVVSRLSIRAAALLLALTIGFAAGYRFNDWLGGRGALAVPTPQPFLAAAEGNSAPPGPLYRQVWDLLARDFYGESPSVTERTYASIRGLTEAYNDPYTYFVEPQPRELERDRFRGRFGGIGAWIDRVEDGYRLRPMPGKPAEAAGVRAGDRLVAVDGTPITVELDQDAVTALIHGPVDTQVCLGLERPDPAGGAPTSLTICIIRTEIEAPSVEWKLLEGSDGVSRIGYIKQTMFSERSAAEMRQALVELQEQGASRFILDLRGNPGGLVDAAVDVAGLWLDGGPVLYERRANGEEQEYVAASGALVPGAPLVVLVDGASASASEIVAGALQDRGRALILGERTFGKGSVQLVHDLEDKSSLHVTTAHWFTPDKHEIEGVGLTPDVVVESGSDPLPQAIDAVQEMVAMK